ncbi:MAG: efflux RND transporter periplasmic adaptor subunit [Endomicrobia bacterium]|nr:efflux RND transporter periplasmic adaptor subunit [Endomicrobiia bacterium]MCL2507293.1 efflux RND transporter periplasmic adaptor subunit [Endomicrobiia bacterium]
MEKIKYYFFLIKDNISHSIGNYRAQEPQAFKRLMYTILICMILIFVAIAVYLLFFNKKAAPEEVVNFIQVKTIRVVKQDFTDKYTVMGSIKGAIENDMRFEIEGLLERYNFREGAHINQGQVICSLNPKDALSKADYAQSRFKSENSSFLSAKERYKVYEEMFRMKALAESKLYEAKFELQAAESRVKSALSELELAQSNVKKTNLEAPTGGILAEIIIKPGEYVTPQDVVCKFISDRGTNFEVDIPEKDLQKLAIGQKVKILSDSFPDREFDGVLMEIAPIVNVRTRTSTVKINVENAQGLLRSGMFARGTIYLRELKNVVLIPADSVVSLNNVTFLVPIVIPDLKPGEGTIQMRPVIVGDKVGDKIVILEGLNIGEMIPAETNGQLSDGARVKFQEMLESDSPVEMQY